MRWHHEDERGIVAIYIAHHGIVERRFTAYSAAEAVAEAKSLQDKDAGEELWVVEDHDYGVELWHDGVTSYVH